VIGRDGGAPNVDPLASRDVELMALEILNLRDLLRGAEAHVGELETRLARLDAQRAHSERMWTERMEHTERMLIAADEQVRALRASRSWRIGQFVLRPVTVWRRLASD
jgi:hypothetical protein